MVLGFLQTKLGNIFVISCVFLLGNFLLDLKNIPQLID